MKRVFALLLALVLLLSMAACGTKKEAVKEDGGVTKSEQTDVPKTIQSTEIEKFECTLSTLDQAEGHELGNKAYTLQAELQNGSVTGKYSSDDRNGGTEEYAFAADVSFMELLQSVVADHDFAAHNGLYEKVDGLPDMYGADLAVVYASGEEIRAYNNQDNFLTNAAMKDLVKLFSLAVLEDMGLDMDEDAQEEETEPEAEQETVPMLSGRYRRTAAEDEMDLWVDVFQYPDFLLLEYHMTQDGSTFLYWAEEFWPNETILGDWSGRTIAGRSQEFSTMFADNRYSGMPCDRLITVTEEELTLQYADMAEEVYVRDESFLPHLTREEQEANLKNYQGETAIPEELVGYWEYWDGSQMLQLTLDKDGFFRLLCKTQGEPVQVLQGVWGVAEESGDLLAYAEMVGGGQMPYAICWQWEIDEYDLLDIFGSNPFRPEEDEGEVEFWPADPEYGLYIDQLQAMGYLYSYYDITGEYTDQYGTDYYYMYQVPQFLEDTDDLAQMNAEILDQFGPIVEMELEAMEKNEFLSADNVWWNAYLTKGILAIHVRSMSWEWEEHGIWYYDTITGTRTDCRDFLNRLDISEEEFLTAVREAAEDCFVEYFSDLPESDREAYGYYDMLEWTVSDEAVNLDLPVFVDEVGNLCVYARIGSMAGASEFWEPLYPFEDWDIHT